MKRRELTEKELYKITESAIFNFLALHYNEEVKHTNFYKKSIKMTLNPAIRELQKAESDFDKIFDISDDTADWVDGLSENIITMIKNFINNQKQVSIFIKGRYMNAFVKDADRINNLVDDILKDNAEKPQQKAQIPTDK